MNKQKPMPITALADHPPDCTSTNSLSLYSLSIDKRRIQHLYNRLGFSASEQEINDAIDKPVSDIVDQLLGNAINQPLPNEEDYPYAHLTSYNNDVDRLENHYDLIDQWVDKMIGQGVLQKLILFWSNHFVIETDKTNNESTYNFQYYYILQKNALGNFKDFLWDIGRTPAMLIYLNGNKNRKGDFVNEDYARKCLELFTMGEGHYAPFDVTEMAKALTGWKTDMASLGFPNEGILPNIYNEFIFNPSDHDFDTKTVFGVSFTPPVQDDGSFDYRMVNQLIFQERGEAVAKFICGKIYRFFVYDEINEEVVNGLATTFIENDFELLPVFKQLFKSEHFFSDAIIGAKIKSPIEWLVNFYRQAGLQSGIDYFKSNANNPEQWTTHQIYLSCNALGQRLFNPPTVAGWSGHRTWLDDNLKNYWKIFDEHLFAFENGFKPLEVNERYRQLLKDLTSNSTDPDYVALQIIEHFITVDLDADQLNDAIAYFKNILPNNYYQGNWNLDIDEIPEQFKEFMVYLSKLPEFVLM